ncbi:MAG: PD40 domain-containing protein [Bacteroidales bacterium]|nr:PD40 domain-containing protein [Bacteroidales bacterium]
MKPRLLNSSLLIGIILLLIPSFSLGQYFGQNKVYYEKFDFEIYETPHFEIYNYQGTTEPMKRLGRQSEHWYDRHFAIFRDTITQNPLIIYNNHPDFQQTTVIGGQIGVGTGGVTEALRKRAIIPFMISNRETDHVLGHEMVHVFQYNMVKQNDTLGLQSLQNIPLWMIEGMAEYLSVGPQDNKTAMWMRDAIIQDDIPSIRDMTRKPNEYFPYRYGHAFWSFVTGVWGDAMIEPVLLATAKYGLNGAVDRLFGLTTDSLSTLWQKSVRETYEPYIKEDTIKPVGRNMFTPENSGELNLSPVLSPDGKHMTFISNYDVITIDILMANTEDRKVIKKLTSAVRQGDIDSYNYIESAGSFSPEGDQYVMTTVAKGRNQLLIANIEGDDVDVTDEINIKGIQAFDNPEWSPDGEKILLTGLVDGKSDLFTYHVKSGRIEQLTDDPYSDLQANWSPDGEKIAFISERGPDTDFEKPAYGKYRLCTLDVETGNVEVLPVFPESDILSPQFSPDGESLYFLSHADGYRNLYEYELETGDVYRLTEFVTGISGITDLAPAYSVASETGEIAYTLYGNDRYSVYMAEPEDFDRVRVDKNLADESASVLPPGRGRVLNIVENNLNRHPTYSEAGFSEKAYDPEFQLDYIGSTGVGVGSSQFGTYASGGVTALWSDVLKRHQLITNLQVQGEIYDFGGYVSYMNQENRLNWGGSVSHIPYRYSYYSFNPRDSLETSEGTIPVSNFIIQQTRIFHDQLALFGRYPLSKKLRFEAGASISRYSYMIQNINNYYYGSMLIDRDKERMREQEPEPFNVGNAYLAYVGDDTNFGITGPLGGYRYRIQAGKMFASYNIVNTQLDYRNYYFQNPWSFGIRALHYARYGPDANELYPLYVGDHYYVRGYSYNSYDQSQGYGANYQNLNYMVGSKMGVINAEVRLPFSGPERLTFIESKYFYTTLVGFIDGGFATEDYDNLAFSWKALQGKNTPIFSTGLALRINLFGYAVLEPYAAIPFQRNDKNFTFGLFIRGSGW